MGGSGGGSTGPSDPAERERIRRQVLKEIEEQELRARCNQFLAEQLVEANQRDAALVKDRLDRLAEALGEEVEDVDRLLFGGSVAKHTYVDGLSDVDALVVLKDTSSSPGELLTRFLAAVQQNLARGDVAEISKGNLAVTVKYADGTEIQLLPAVERDGRTSIASADGTGWQQIRPHKFAEKLTEANKRNDLVVPTIKLAKGLLDARLPDWQRPGGYHLEALAVDAFRDYNGRADRASMLEHLVRHASDRVLVPSADITGQSLHIDDSLGAAGSPQRQALSRALGRVADQLGAARSVEQYRQLFE